MSHYIYKKGGETMNSEDYKLLIESNFRVIADEMDRIITELSKFVSYNEVHTFIKELLDIKNKFVSKTSNVMSNIEFDEKIFESYEEMKKSFYASFMNKYKEYKKYYDEIIFPFDLATKTKEMIKTILDGKKYPISLKKDFDSNRISTSIKTKASIESLLELMDEIKKNIEIIKARLGDKESDSITRLNFDYNCALLYRDAVISQYDLNKIPFMKQIKNMKPFDLSNYSSSGIELLSKGLIIGHTEFFKKHSVIKNVSDIGSEINIRNVESIEFDYNALVNKIICSELNSIAENALGKYNGINIDGLPYNSANLFKINITNHEEPTDEEISKLNYMCEHYNEIIEREKSRINEKLSSYKHYYIHELFNKIMASKQRCSGYQLFPIHNGCKNEMDEVLEKFNMISEVMVPLFYSDKVCDEELMFLCVFSTLITSNKNGAVSIYMDSFKKEYLELIKKVVLEFKNNALYCNDNNYFNYYFRLAKKLSKLNPEEDPIKACCGLFRDVARYNYDIPESIYNEWLLKQSLKKERKTNRVKSTTKGIEAQLVNYEDSSYLQKKDYRNDLIKNDEYKIIKKL